MPEQSFDDIIKAVFDDKNLFFYQSYFRPVGQAEAVLDANPRDFLRRFYYVGSGDIDLDGPADQQDLGGQSPGRAARSRSVPGMADGSGHRLLRGRVHRLGLLRAAQPIPQPRPATGRFLQPYKARKIEPPSFFIAGDRDGAFTRLRHGPGSIATLRQHASQLEGAHVLPGCGHWTQQERPEEVNALLIPWLTSLKGRVV